MNRLRLVIAFWLLLTGAACAQGGMGPGPGTPHTTGGGGGFSLTYQSKAANGSGAATQHYALTFAASATRAVAVLEWYVGASNTITSVAIGSSTFSQVSGAYKQRGAIAVDVWISDAPLAGTSGTLDVVYSAGPGYTNAVGLYNLVTTTPAASATAVNDSQATGTTLSLLSPITVPSGGGAIVACLNSNGSTITPSNFTSDALDTTGGVQMVFGHTTSTGSINPTATEANDTWVMSVVAWGP